MDLKINSFIVFVFLGCASAFAQDPAKSPPAIYKISGAELKASSAAEEPKVVPKDVRSIHSCEVKKKEVIITRKNPDGTLITERSELKEKK